MIPAAVSAPAHSGSIIWTSATVSSTVAAVSAASRSSRSRLTCRGRSAADRGERPRPRVARPAPARRPVARDTELSAASAAANTPGQRDQQDGDDDQRNGAITMVAASRQAQSSRPDGAEHGGVAAALRLARGGLLAARRASRRAAGPAARTSRAPARARRGRSRAGAARRARSAGAARRPARGPAVRACALANSGQSTMSPSSAGPMSGASGRRDSSASSSIGKDMTSVGPGSSIQRSCSSLMTSVVTARMLSSAAGLTRIASRACRATEAISDSSTATPDSLQTSMDTFFPCSTRFRVVLASLDRRPSARG